MLTVCAFANARGYRKVKYCFRNAADSLVR